MIGEYDAMALTEHVGAWDMGAGTAAPRIVEDPSKTYSYVSHVNEVEVRSADDAFDFLQKGYANRRVCRATVLVCGLIASCGSIDGCHRAQHKLQPQPLCADNPGWKDTAIDLESFR